MLKHGATHQKKHGKKQTTKFCAKIELVLPNKEEQTEIYTITRAYGNGYFQLVKYQATDEIKASITRSFKKGPTKEIISIGDNVLVQPGISKEQYFIIHRYSLSDMNELETLGHITPTKLERRLCNEDDDGLDFDDAANLDDCEDLFDNL